MVKTMLKLVAVIAVAALAIGCNTIEGFGKDLQAAGDWITSTVKKDDSRAASPTAKAPAPAPVTEPSQTTRW